MPLEPTSMVPELSLGQNWALFLEQLSHPDPPAVFPTGSSLEGVMNGS